MTPLAPQVLLLADLPADSPMPLLERRRVIGQKMMVSDIHLKKGFAVPTHAHENEQISIVLSGRLRFTLGPEPAAAASGPTPGRLPPPPNPPKPLHVLSAGMAIVLPSNLPHAAEALDDVHVLDLFSPPSQGTGIDRPRAR
jgi:quercetin dioxygenase-like cupin family protein